jgi:hypothetical protein
MLHFVGAFLPKKSLCINRGEFLLDTLSATAAGHSGPPHSIAHVGNDEPGEKVETYW